MGSCRDKAFTPIRKRVLKTFSILDLALIEEMRIHVTKDVGPNPRYANGATLRPKGMSRKNVPVSKETRIKMSNSQSLRTDNRGKQASKVSNPISLQRCSDQKIFTFKSQKEAADTLKISMGNLSQVVRGKRKHVGGFTFLGKTV